MTPNLLKQLFYSEIRPQLFPSNTFLARARRDDAFVNYDQVNLPHSGTIPGAAVNRAVLPGTIAQRTDAVTSYSLEEITTDPTLLQYSEELLVNYNKRASILEQHVNSLNSRMGSRSLYKWAAPCDAGNYTTTGHIIKTTGKTDGNAAVARNAAGPSQTGTRKPVGKDDIIAVRQIFFKDNVILGNSDVQGIAVLTPTQYGDLVGLPNVAEAQKYGRATFPTGVVDRVLGFDIYVRSSVVVTDSSFALKTLPYNSDAPTGSSGDNDAALFYHPDFVRAAMGQVKPFVQVDNPAYYGDIFSMLVRFGAAQARNDSKGVVMLTETP